MAKASVDRRILIALCILFFSIAIRIPFRSKMFANWDGPQFAIAINNYSLKDYFPAPPGHFLYVMTAKLINFFLNDKFISLLSLSIFFSSLICASLFLIGSKIFNFKVGLISSLLYMASPLFWFYSTTITVLPMSGFFALVTGFFLFRVISKKEEKFFIWSSFFYGLMIGIRPQDFIFILPLWIWAISKVKLKLKVLGLLVLVLVCFLWFISLSIMSGGIKEFISFILKEISSGSTRLSSSIFTIPRLIKANLKYQIFTYLIAFGIGAIPFFYYLPQFFSLKNIFLDKKVQIFLVWILPTLIFWSIYNFATPGYIIVSLLPLIILLAEFLTKMSDELTGILLPKFRYLKNKDIILIPFMFMLIIINTVIYLYDFHPQDKGSNLDSFRRYPDNRKMDIQLSKKFQYIRENISPENSIIIASSSYFMQAMYYLSQYHIYLFSGITREGSKSVLYGYKFKRYNFDSFNMLNLLSDNRINRIVFFDDIFNKWIDTQAKKETIPITDQYSLTVVYPDREDKLMYSYKDIQIK